MNTYIWISVLIIAAITALLRFLPFAIWSGDREIPEIINKFGRVLPYSIMGMLVVYCLRNVNFGSLQGFIPELTAVIITSASYIWKRNTLISILLGTVCYMVLVQAVF